MTDDFEKFEVREVAPEDAIAELLDTFDGHTLFDLGPHMTCTEVNVFAEFLQAHNRAKEAQTLLQGHALEDDEGDIHWTPDGTVYEVGGKG